MRTKIAHHINFIQQNYCALDSHTRILMCFFVPFSSWWLFFFLHINRLRKVDDFTVQVRKFWKFSLLKMNEYVRAYVTRSINKRENSATKLRIRQTNAENDQNRMEKRHFFYITVHSMCKNDSNRSFHGIVTMLKTNWHRTASLQFGWKECESEKNTVSVRNFRCHALASRSFAAFFHTRNGYV